MVGADALNPLPTEQFRVEHARLRAKESPCAVLSEALGELKSHELSAQDSASLMDRVDNKFLSTYEDALGLLNRLASNYSILEMADKRLFTYQNTYFDSPSFDYYLQHHNGRLNRHKIRYRRYAETDTEYLEVKFKTNKRRTIKERIQLDSSRDVLCDQSRDFVQQRLPSHETERLGPSLHINYQRATLMSEDGEERITFDFDIRFASNDPSKQQRLQNLVIIENKRAGHVTHTEFLRMAREMHLKKSSFSKYCIGCCLTEPGRLKMNLFKPLLRTLHGNFRQETLELATHV